MSAPSPDVLALLRAILDELRGLRADARRSTPIAVAGVALLAAIADYFGEGRFTVAGLLAVDDIAIADALGDMVDMNAAPRSRATALGLLLARMPDVEIVAQQRGCSVYRLRTLGA
jgi:hypothetical protein